MGSIALSTSKAESIQIVSQNSREWWNIELASSDVVYAYAAHLNIIRRQWTDIERQKLGIVRENSPKRLKKLGILGNFRAVRMAAISYTLITFAAVPKSLISLPAFLPLITVVTASVFFVTDITFFIITIVNLRIITICSSIINIIIMIAQMGNHQAMVMIGIIYQNFFKIIKSFNMTSSY